MELHKNGQIRLRSTMYADHLTDYSQAGGDTTSLSKGGRRVPEVYLSVYGNLTFGYCNLRLILIRYFSFFCF